LGEFGVILTRRLNSQLRHAGLDPASSVLLDSRLRVNDELRVFIRRSNMSYYLYPDMGRATDFYPADQNLGSFLPGAFQAEIAELRHQAMEFTANLPIQKIDEGST